MLVSCELCTSCKSYKKGNWSSIVGPILPHIGHDPDKHGPVLIYC